MRVTIAYLLEMVEDRGLYMALDYLHWTHLYGRAIMPLWRDTQALIYKRETLTDSIPEKRALDPEIDKMLEAVQVEIDKLKEP